MELLKVQEYATRMKVCRTTIFVWLKKNVIKNGEHYIKVGRCLRFIWDASTIKSLHNAIPIDTDIKSKKPSVVSHPRKRKKIVIDMNY
jgi:hypothetical protein